MSRRHAAVITVSDSCAAGQREDLSGPAVMNRLEALGWTVESLIVADELAVISQEIARLADSDRFAAILTTGGTGVAPRDVTPEATRAVIEREIPGLGELMRASGLEFTRRAVLSRATAGTRGRTLVVNLPGSPKGALESLDCIVDLIPHIVDLLDGNTEHPPAGETTPTMRTSEK
jgi:molybdenum cofactor synthesis domain-containing protein